jgi:SDR family mycofactocin-dependent oxidoreductase
MGQLSGKTAFITGGGRGMGREIATTFAAAGAKIVICDIAANMAEVTYDLASPEDVQETKRLVEEAGSECLACIADVRSQEELDEAVAEGIASFGAIDIAIANAGITVWSGDRIWETSEESWQSQIDVCLTGVFHTAKAVAPHMIERESGNMIFTSSNSGVEGSVALGPYVAAKHGVIGLMRSAALELGRYGIRVNAVLPSTTDTLINDNPGGRTFAGGGRHLTREEYLDAVHYWTLLRDTGSLPPSAIAEGMLWLASDAARYVTGIELKIDAGHLILPGLNMGPVRTDK